MIITIGGTKFFDIGSENLRLITFENVKQKIKKINFII